MMPMKIVSICDEKDICTGLQLAGIEAVLGGIVHTPEEFYQAFNNAVRDRQAGIVVITKKLMERYASQINEVRLSKTTPLIVEI